MQGSASLKVITGFVLGAAVSSGIWYFTGNKVEPQQAGGEPLYEYAGKVYHSDDLDSANARRYFDLETEYKNQLKGFASELMVQQYLTDKAAKEGITKEQALEQLLDLKQPDEKEIEALYDQLKGRIGQPLDVVKGQLAQYLMQQQIIAKRDQLLSDVEQQKQAKVLVKDPVAPKTVLNVEGFPAKGSDNPKLTIVEFFDYRCPHCATADKTLNELVAKHSDKIRLVHVNFPLDPREGSVSRVLGEGAVCAAEQGKYWDYNKEAFADQASLSDASPLLLAEKLKLDIDSFKTCMASDKAKQSVDAGEAEGKRIGISGTPAIFINGKPIRPSDLEEGLSKLVEKKLQAAG